MYVLLIVLFVVIGKFLVNLCRLLCTMYYYKKFTMRTNNLEVYSKSVEKLFDFAGTDLELQICQSTYGLDEIYVEKLSHCLTEVDLKEKLNSKFLDTIGVYRSRLFESINLIYWLTFPSRIANRIVKRDLSIPWKILINLFVWILGVIAAYFIELFLGQYILPIVQRLL